MVKIDIDMPKTCFVCPFAFTYFHRPYSMCNSKYKLDNVNSYICCLTNKAMTSTKRERHCPLVEEI